MSIIKNAQYLLYLFCFILIALPVQAAETRTRTLVTGAQFQGANGIRVSPEGPVYVTSAVGSRIDALDPRSGKRLQTWGQAQGVFGPDDLAFAPDGRLYFTAFFTGEVMRLTADGQAELVARVGPGANAISFSDSGRLFVSRVFLADELYEIDPAGLQAPRLIRQGLGGLNAMDFGPDGYLYGPLWFKGQVIRLDVDSGDYGVVAEGIDTPAAVKFSPDGRLHAIDQHQGTVLRIDVDTGAKHVVAYPGLGADNLDFDARGRMYITNAHEGGVSRVLPNGRVRALSPGGLAMAAGITSHRGELVVAAAQSLRRYDAQTGREIEVVHASIGDPTTVATPLTVSTFGERLLVTSWFSNTVQVWDPVRQSVVTTHRDFQVPLNAIDLDGDIVVAELAAHRVVRRKAGTADTEVLMAGIAVPTGLAAAGGDLYAADWLSGTVYQLMAGDMVLATPHAVVTGLSRPEGMALDAEGRLLVVETGQRRLLRIDPRDAGIEVLADELAVGLSGVPGYPPSWLLSSVTLDACGRITLTQDLNNSLLRVVPDEGVAGTCRDSKS